MSTPEQDPSARIADDLGMMMSARQKARLAEIQPKSIWLSNPVDAGLSGTEDRFRISEAAGIEASLTHHPDLDAGLTRAFRRAAESVGEDAPREPVEWTGAMIVTLLVFTGLFGVLVGIACGTGFRNPEIITLVFDVVLIAAGVAGGMLITAGFGLYGRGR